MKKKKKITDGNCIDHYIFFCFFLWLCLIYLTHALFEVFILLVKERKKLYAYEIFVYKTYNEITKI